MKLKFNESFGTAAYTYCAGEEADIDKAVAKSLIEAGIASPVGSTPAKRASTRKQSE